MTRTVQRSEGKNAKNAGWLERVQLPQSSFLAESESGPCCTPSLGVVNEISVYAVTVEYENEDDRGLTRPYYVDIALTACIENGVWKACTTYVRGYCVMQTRSLGLTPVVAPSAGGPTPSPSTICQQIESLRMLGRTGHNHGYWNESATLAHEEFHRERLVQDLDEAVFWSTMVSTINQLTDSNLTKSQSQVIQDFKSTTTYTNARQDVFNLWSSIAEISSDNDHGSTNAGAAYQESCDHNRATWRELCQYIYDNSWTSCSYCTQVPSPTIPCLY